MSDSIANVVLTNADQTINRHNVALLGEETGQQLSLRVQEIPAGYGVPLHSHLEQAETFHIVQGRFLFQVGGEQLEAGPGQSIHVPKGTPHSFRYLDELPGQLISVLTPGIHDGFLLHLPEAQAEGASPEEQTRIAAENGVVIHGPGV